MKKLLLLIFLIILRPINSFWEVVPCSESKCDQKFDLTLTRFIEAKEKNNKPIIVWLSGGAGLFFSADPLSEVKGKYDIIVVFNLYNISSGSQNRTDGYAPAAYKPD